MYKFSESDKKIEFVISSEMKNVDHIAKTGQAFLQQKGTANESEFKVVLRELLINAIEHGNRNGTDKKVHCTIEQEAPDYFSIVVKDEGTGFDTKSLEMTLPEDPNKTRKRGYALINEFAEEIRFNKKGNRVTVYVRMSMQTAFSIDEEDGWQVIRPSGDLTATVAEDFRLLLNNFVQQNHTRFRFNLVNVNDIDSVCLSVFIVLSKILKNKKDCTDLEIVHAKQDLVNLFRLTRMDEIYHIFETGQEKDNGL